MAALTVPSYGCYVELQEAERPYGIRNVMRAGCI